MSGGFTRSTPTSAVAARPWQKANRSSFLKAGSVMIASAGGGGTREGLSPGMPRSANNDAYQHRGQGRTQIREWRFSTLARRAASTVERAARSPAAYRGALRYLREAGTLGRPNGVVARFSDAAAHSLSK